jgi:hypothetical protein
MKARLYVNVGAVLLAAICSIHDSAGDTAEPCTQQACRLPYCRCAGTDIPGGLPSYETPQIVTIVINEAVRNEDYDFYQELFRYKNPNGCPHRGTFLVTHNYTDYAAVENLYAQGHEIGDNTVTQQPPEEYWLNISYEKLEREIQDERTILSYWTNTPLDAIRGFRAPYLITSENEIKALYNLRFLYDATMHSEVMYWPFTLDYQSPLCNFPDTCPTGSYPGFWVIPNTEWVKATGEQCETVPECRNVTISSQSEWYNLVKSNFRRHYYGNRAPFGIYFDPQIFYEDDKNAFYALEQFLGELQSYTDVYVVTLYQLLEWTRVPTPLSKIFSFTPWQCPSRPPARCTLETEKRCGPYLVGEEQRYFTICGTVCPRNYPNIGNPYGQ